jgi:hypothetical protein
MSDAMVSSMLIVDDDAAFLGLAERILDETGVEAVSTRAAAGDMRRPFIATEALARGAAALAGGRVDVLDLQA